MSWVSAGVGAATVVSGLFGSSKAAKQQKKELALRREALAFDKQRYNEANTLYGDSIKGLVALANEDANPDLAGATSRALADVTTHFGNAQEILARQNARMGINPNSGQAQSAMRQTALAEALAKTGSGTAAREQERTNAKNQQWSRLSHVAGLGINQMNGTANNVNQSTVGLANTYGTNASYLNQAASNALSSGLSTIANIDWSKLKTTTP